ncbi:eukaryotic translation initiation factor 3 subunit B [Wallemia mellicola]|nr:eukaryotic translation initiation factor 3 subunit B [Wallemia mellicola]TIC40308.1 eukaryotic translation initiation factor 3 subunit B [Wallemia mellicola]TIC46168.1 eukaryotic translation initiation factor 3 subunit B [Wallemia mellicola]TIC58220.1 eukaryotic translation initiation factor 3 subunit B [Wallemia mellicola]
MSVEEIDFSDIYKKHQLEDLNHLDSIVVLDGMPEVGEDKMPKLFKALRKTFSGKAQIEVEDDQFYMPMTEGKGQGYIFLTLKNSQEATNLIARLDNAPFDSKHTFLINKFSEIDQYLNASDQFVQPTIQEYKPKDHLRSWLSDSQGRDQFISFQNDQVNLNYHNRSGAPQVVQTKNNWTNSYITFSPEGTYIATLHRQGVMLHGGPALNEVCRFAHPNVKLVDFSPKENYFVTWSNEPIVLPQPGSSTVCPFSEDDQGNSLAVWNIKTGDLLRTFPTTPGKMPWPHIKWSGDEKYIARLVPGQQISIYGVPDMGLVDKKSLKIPGVVDFDWCPWGDKDAIASANNKGTRENMLAYWTPEVENQPARVTLLSFPSRQVLRSKNLFNVSNAKLNWHNHGDFLCVQVHRHTKTKKSMFCNLEIFRVREKDYPVEVVELKDLVTFFAWEPKGERFAIITQPDTTANQQLAPGVTLKTAASFYQLDKAKGVFKLLKTLENKSVNTIHWSPRGRHLILATIGSQSKFDLEFWDADYAADEKKEEIQQIANAEFYGITDIEWDPSGRFIAASASVWRHQLENGYAVWDIKGQELTKASVENFKQFLWRPRPKTLLPKDEQKKIRKNLREYSRIFEDEDAAEESNVSAELLTQRKRLVDQWNEWRKRCRASLEQIQSEQKSSNQGKDDTTVEEWIDEIIEETEEVLA